jgi:hypothetical protein
VTTTNMFNFHLLGRLKISTIRSNKGVKYMMIMPMIFPFLLFVFKFGVTLQITLFVIYILVYFA